MSRSPLWLRHYSFECPPFAKDLADAELWLPSSKQALLDTMVEALDERQHVLLTGEPGMGKTCLLRALRQRLPEAGFRLTYCHNATLGRRDFYRQLCLALGLHPKATAAAVFNAVAEHVEQLSREHRHPVFLLDESQLLKQEVLEHLHVLANYDFDSKPLLSLVLVGLPDLWDILKARINRSLWSRVHCRIAIPEATPADTAEYIQHRISQAKGPKTLFSSDAISVLHEGTLGHLRDLDRVATNAIKAAAQRKLTTIDRAVISEVLDADSGLSD